MSYSMLADDVGLIIEERIGDRLDQIISLLEKLVEQQPQQAVTLEDGEKMAKMRAPREVEPLSFEAEGEA